MAMRKIVPLDVAAITGIAGLPPVNVEQISRLDRLEIDTRPGEANLTLKASTYASEAAIAMRTPISGADEEVTFLKQVQPAIPAIVDPETGEVLEPAVPPIPSFAQLMNSPLRSPVPVMTTVGDSWKLFMKQMNIVWQEQKTHWQGSTEV